MWSGNLREYSFIISVASHAWPDIFLRQVRSGYTRLSIIYVRAWVDIPAYHCESIIVHVKCYIIILLPCKCIHNVLFLLMCIVYIYCCSLCLSLKKKKKTVRVFNAVRVGFGSGECTCCVTCSGDDLSVYGNGVCMYMHKAG